jgi:hypothetical protein
VKTGGEFLQLSSIAEKHFAEKSYDDRMVEHILNDKKKNHHKKHAIKGKYFGKKHHKKHGPKKRHDKNHHHRHSHHHAHAAEQSLLEEHERLLPDSLHTPHLLNGGRVLLEGGINVLFFLPF